MAPYLLVMAAVLLLWALTNVPYNGDSMSYHLPRIAHWAQNGSVAFFATNDLRQVTNPTLAEFINLHVYILCGKRDNFFNLLQFVSFLNNIALIYCLCRKLKCKPKYAFISALLLFSMPIAFSEAVSTQNDNFSTVWLLYYVYILLDFTQPDKKLAFEKTTVVRVLLLGLHVSLGYWTKPSVSIGMLFFACWLLLICIIRRDRPLVILKLVICALPFVVLPLVPELLRMLLTFHAFTVPVMSSGLLAQSLDPLHLFVGCVKNLFVNAAAPLIGYSAFYLGKAMEAICSITGVGLNGFYVLQAPDYSHDTAPSPLVFYSALTSAAVLFVLWLRKRDSKVIYSYSLAAAACFVAICAALNWDLCNPRYMLGYLTLLCPITGCALQKIDDTKLCKTGTLVLSFLCAVELASMQVYQAASCFGRANYSRPVGYFAVFPDEYEPMGEHICPLILEHGYKNVGLDTALLYEYPLWYMLRSSGTRIEHVMVDNETARYADPDFVPDCVIGRGILTNDTLMIGEQGYRLVWEDGQYYLLEKAAP